MNEIKAHGTVLSGKLTIRSRSRFDHCLSAFPDCEVEVRVRKLYSRRSARIVHEDGRVTRGQNGYYHGVICQALIDGAWEQNGEVYDQERAHSELKANCNYEERYNEETGTIRRVVRSTSTLDTMQFEDYLSRCREWLREWFGIDCPPPDGTQAKLIFK